VSYGYRYDMPGSPQRRRRGAGMTCLLVLTLLVFLLLILGALLLVFVRPQISRQAGQVIGNQLEEQINTQIKARLGDASEIPPDFEGTVTITDAEVNQYISEHPDEIAPAESAEVHFVPGEVQASLTAYGLSGTARAGLELQNGRVEAVNPSIDGALGFVLDADQIASALEDALNTQLNSQGRRVTAIAIEEGTIVASVGPE
jgi:hypothetical protein